MGEYSTVNFIRVVYAYSYPTQPTHTTASVERTDGEIYIVAECRPPLPALKKMVAKHGRNKPGAKDFRVLAWDAVGADEVGVNEVIVNYDDEREEEA